MYPLGHTSETVDPVRGKPVTDSGQENAVTDDQLALSGALRKMRVSADNPVRYGLRVGEQTLDVNPLIGRSLRIDWLGTIHCIHCGRATKKSFSQGYCWPCFQSLAETDQCIMAPEKCHYHKGTCRDPAWGARHCMQPHVVYLANTSGLKVGITRATQIPVRWIDQGAVSALPIVTVATRQQAGLVEDALRAYTSDRTQWQRMLKGEQPDLSLGDEWQRLRECSQTALDELTGRFGAEAIQLHEQDTRTPVDLHYPLVSPPVKVKALNLEKLGTVSGVLQGVKGQYLVFDTGVMNVRKFTGYDVRIDSPADTEPDPKS